MNFSTTTKLSKFISILTQTSQLLLLFEYAVRAGESLMKLVSELKQYLILNDFHSVNSAIVKNSHLYRRAQAECDKKLVNLREAAAADLHELEEEYYTSEFKRDGNK